MEDQESRDQRLTVLPRQEVVAQSPMEALAAMSDAEFRARLDALKKGQARMATIQREMMTEDVDYGVIPGTGNKPTLLKPGSEILCNFHKLRPTFVFTTAYGDGATSPTIRVEAICSLHVENSDGPVVGQGVGACNSWEKKYRWRDGQRVCPQCGQPSISKSKEEYGGGWYCNQKRGGCGAKFKKGDADIESQTLGQVENSDPFDLENTIKKMAAKRAQVDATLRTTATSGLFTQDVEDMEPATAPAPKPAVRPAPAPRPQNRPAQAEAEHIEAQANFDPDAMADGDEGVPPPPVTRQDRIAAWQAAAREAKAMGLPVMGITKSTSDADIDHATAALKAAIANANAPAEKPKPPAPNGAGLPEKITAEQMTRALFLIGELEWDTAKVGAELTVLCSKDNLDDLTFDQAHEFITSLEARRQAQEVAF